jgi:hypothetical protein
MYLFPSFRKTRLHLKDHFGNAVRGNNRCLFSESYETHTWNLQNILNVDMPQPFVIYVHN